MAVETAAVLGYTLIVGHCEEVARLSLVREEV